MSKKKNRGGLVYSTNSNYLNNDEPSQENTPDPANQKLKISLDTKHRGGKTVVLIQNFVGSDDEAKSLCKRLKQYCGTGGSYKEGNLIIQGNALEKVRKFLTQHGYGTR